MDYAGVELPDPRDGEMALGAVVLMKVMNPDGSIVYRECTSDSIHAIEMLGMVETFRDTLKHTIMGGIRTRGPADED